MGKNVTKDLKTILGSAAERAELLVAQLADLDEKIENRDHRISKQVIDGELQPQRSAVHIKLTNLKDETLRTVKKYVDDTCTEIMRDEAARSDEVNDDIKLLTGDFDLTANDIDGLFRRNQNNRTMSRKIYGYAKEHGIDTGDWVIRTGEDRKNDVKRCNNFASMFVDHWMEKPGSRDMLDKLLPEDE